MAKKKKKREPGAKPFPLLRFDRLKTYPLARGKRKVSASAFAGLHVPGDSFKAFLDRLPPILAASDLRAVIERVATAARDLVRDGVLLGYVLDSYSGRKLKLPTTGNAGGVHNLTLDPSGPEGLDGLLKQMGTGLLVTELIGFGVNTVTGDYSRGAAGFWVENGEVQYPVEEITIAGNLKDMYRAIAAAGSDVDTRGNIRTGSILLGAMTVAGS